MIAIFNKAMKENLPINIYGDGSQIRDFIYVEDIANICVQAIESDIKNEIINLSTNKGVTLNKLFDEMSSIYNYKQPINYLLEREGDIKDSILSNDKVKNIFNNINYTDLFEGLEKMKGNLRA